LPVRSISLPSSFTNIPILGLKSLYLTVEFSYTLRKFENGSVEKAFFDSWIYNFGRRLYFADVSVIEAKGDRSLTAQSRINVCRAIANNYMIREGRQGRDLTEAKQPRTIMLGGTYFKIHQWGLAN